MLVTFSTAVTRCLRKSTYRRKGLFWVITSEVSVHGYLLHCSEPVVRQGIMVESLWWSKLDPLMVDRRRRVSRSDWGHGTPFQDKSPPPVTYFLQLGTSPSFHHLPIITPNYESINPSTYWSTHEVRVLMIQPCPKPISCHQAFNTQAFMGHYRIKV
jgi:hypothetical protein